MVISPTIANLQALKLVLQELEAAVQEPRDESFSVQHVLDSFPAVFSLFYDTLTLQLARLDVAVASPQAAVVEAHKKGWLRGDLSLWLRLASDYQAVKEDECHGSRAHAVAQDIRACSYLFWETYELLMAKFRWQTQVSTPANRANQRSAGMSAAA